MAAGRVVALYDIHGNLPALDAVLAEVEALVPDVVVIGGDVAWGPMPAEVLDRLEGLSVPVRWVMGNADREVVEAYDDPGSRDDPIDRFCAGRISQSQRDLLASFDPTVQIDVEGLGAVLFCHGSPRSDTERITRITSDERLTGILEGVRHTVIVGGHTHQQFDRRLQGWRFVNAGSVGMPYEGDRAAFWLVLGPDVEMRRTGYDVEGALAAMARTGMPDLEELLRESLMDPIAPEEVAEFFERQA